MCVVDSIYPPVYVAAQQPETVPVRNDARNEICVVIQFSQRALRESSMPLGTKRGRHTSRI